MNERTRNAYYSLVLKEATEKQYKENMQREKRAPTLKHDP